MTKARILANLISDNAELADGQISVAEVVGAAPLANPTFTGTASGTFSGPLTGNVVGNLTGNVTGAVTGAVTGDVTAPEIDLTAIAKDISDTAVDVFIYDTSKDSDGGAWRKRTQHTSWYNEAASATRGSRKEFPSVAVIVAESNQVTIYDGDDPDLPMWMVFNSNTDFPNYGLYGTNIYAISGLNGILAVGSNERIHTVNFVTDEIRWASSSTSAISIGISNREGSANVTQVASDFYLGLIVNSIINDVAMTVLPNAPIDSATGLPVPTIAVATEAGMSFIKDDGTVVDFTSTNASYDNVKKVEFSGDDSIIATVQTYDSQGYYFVLRHLIPNIDDTYNFSSTGASSQNYSEYTAPYIYNRSSSSGYTNSIASSTTGQFATGINESNKVLSIVDPLPEDSKSYGMVAGITSGWNTGWMNGEIKLATLSDTDDTDVTGAELVTNGTFDSDTSGWTAVGSTLSVTGGTLQVVGTANFNYATQTVTGLTVGKKYVFQADIVTGSGNSYIYVRRGDNGGGITNGSANGVGSYALTFEAPTTSVEIRLYQIYQTTSKFDNASVRLAEEDRSINGKGLQVFGTVPKTVVASGANLVAYGPFTSSNYLQQPYNSSLDFGTGDFMYSMWIYRNSLPTSGHERWFGTAATSSDERIDIFSNSNTDNIAFYCHDNNAVCADLRITGVGTNVWHCFHFTRQGRIHKIYQNGELRGTLVGSTTLANYQGASGNRRTHIGSAGHWDSTHPVLDGKIALAKISGTVPSPEQIAKIYNDEKHLFQENAKATLYAASPASGSPDAVTALAYDDATDLLHVGTDNGRSVFQGLRRVDNTTDAVGAAISASNGLVAED